MSLKIVISVFALLVCTDKIVECVAAAVKSNTSRKVDDLVKIANGWVVAIAEYPFMVSVQQDFGNRCAGTLIHPTWVMTAANCLAKGVYPKGKKPYGFQEPVNDYKNYSVVAGLTTVSCVNLTVDDKGADNPNRRQVVKFHRHEEYSSVTDEIRYWNDIALMALDSAFGEDIGVSVGYLVPPDFDEPADAELVAIGWGFDPRTAAEIYSKDTICPDKYHDLKGIYVAITNRSYCTTKGAIMLEETSLCVDLSGDDTSWCNRDQGGPLILQDGTSRVVGVASAGADLTRCHANSMAVFTRVAKYRDWIDKLVPLEDRVPSTTSQLKHSLIYLIISIYVLLI